MNQFKETTKRKGKVLQFLLKPDETFYNQRIRPILMPFLKNLLSNMEIESAIGPENKSKFREVIFTE